MRFNNKIYQKIRLVCLLAFCMLLSWPVNGQQMAQKQKKVRQLIDVTLKVTDDNGTPIPKASVVVGEGIIHTETDQNGSVAFKGYAVDVVTVMSPGFEKNASPVSDIILNNTIKLKKAKIHMTSDDVVDMPFNSMKRRHLTGPDVTLPGKYFSRYPSVDIRNTFTGMTSGWDIREQDGSPGISSQEGLTAYSGLSNAFGGSDKFSNIPFVLVDGVPTELQEQPMDPAEIESATLVKGILGTAMYGPMATGGLLMIKTKSGVKNERMLDVDIETGISTIDRMPVFTGGVDYANLNNTARVNSGLAVKYLPTAIDAYALNNANDLRYPNVNWRDQTIQNSKSFTRVNMSSSGGNDVVQYYSSLGYAKEGDIYKIGSLSSYDRINVRQNVNANITPQIDVKFSFYGNMSFRRSPNYGYSSNYTSETASSNPVLGLTEFPYSSNGNSTSPGSYGVLNDINLTPPIAFPLIAFQDTVNKIPWYGVSSSYIQNPVGGLKDQGYYSDQGRTGASNLTFNWDFGNVVKGLKSSTFLGFNVHDMVRIGKANDYLAYTSSISSKTGNDTIIRTSSHGLVTQSDNAKLLDYYFQRYSFYENLNYDRTFGDHTVQGSLVYNRVKAFINGVEEPTRDQSLIFSGLYSFKDKYSFQAVLNYAGATSFSASKRFGLFPSLGANWVMSEENFMSGLKFVNYLKLRAQYGVIGNQTNLPVFYYVDRWSQDNSGSAFGPLNSNTWFGSTTESGVYRNSPQRVGNPDLTWEKRKEFNAGFDALFMNQKLSLDVTYYNILQEGAIVQLANRLPFIAGLNNARPWYNFTNTRYNMLTADIHFADKAGELSYNFGVTATYNKGMREKYDEPNYRFDYQRRTGQSSDAIFGLVYQGKFTASDFDGSGNFASGVTPQLFDAKLQAGDLKYQDLNGDGFIDDQDQKVIGHSSPRLFYGLNLDLKYKNFELYVMGNGRAFYDIALTNSYYWSGWGDNNYSSFVANNVDQTTGLGDKYPRLTYYKVNNNFMTSAFWLTKGDYFKIQNIELSYTVPAKMLQFIGGRAIRIYVRGANLLTISKVKDVDPESINSGVTTYPLFRTFTGGVKFNF